MIGIYICKVIYTNTASLQTSHSLSIMTYVYYIWEGPSNYGV